MYKRILALFLSILMLCTASVSASAAALNLPGQMTGGGSGPDKSADAELQAMIAAKKDAVHRRHPRLPGSHPG